MAQLTAPSDGMFRRKIGVRSGTELRAVQGSQTSLVWVSQSLGRRRSARADAAHWTANQAVGHDRPVLSTRAYGKLRLTRTRVSKVGRLLVAPGYWPTVRLGVVPSVEHAAVPFRDDIKTVVDVGASRGQFASFAAHRFPEAQLICFEPLPDARAVLKNVVAGRATIHAAAVGATAGTATLNVSGQDDSSSLLPIGHRQIEEFPGTEASTTLEVRVEVLSDLDLVSLHGPRLLKIDVQGFELDVLKGAGANLDLFDQAFVECSFVELYDGQALADEVIAFLLARGLRLAGCFGTVCGAKGEAIQADLLFNRRHCG